MKSKILNIYITVIVNFSKIRALGNAGGYLGLFLGYTLLNIPEFVQKGFNAISKRFKNHQILTKRCSTEKVDIETG